MPFPVDAFEDKNLKLQFYVSNAPIFVSVYKPTMNPIDYLTYFLSCISFRFGFSPLTFLSSDAVRRIYEVKATRLNAREVDKTQLKQINQRFVVLERFDKEMFAMMSMAENRLGSLDANANRKIFGRLD